MKASSEQGDKNVFVMPGRESRPGFVGLDDHRCKKCQLFDCNPRNVYERLWSGPVAPLHAVGEASNILIGHHDSHVTIAGSSTHSLDPKDLTRSTIQIRNRRSSSSHHLPNEGTLNYHLESREPVLASDPMPILSSSIH